MVLCGVNLGMPAARAAVWPLCVWCAAAVCQQKVVWCWLHTKHGPQRSSCCGHHHADPSHKTIYNNITYVVISKTILMTVSFIRNNM